MTFELGLDLNLDGLEDLECIGKVPTYDVDTGRPVVRGDTEIRRGRDMSEEAHVWRSSSEEGEMAKSQAINTEAAVGESSMWEKV